MLAPLLTRWSYPALCYKSTDNADADVKHKTETLHRLTLRVKGSELAAILKSLDGSGPNSSGEEFPESTSGPEAMEAKNTARLERERLEMELTDLVTEWQRTAREWQGYHKRYGKWAAEKHLDKLQARYERRSRGVIRRHYRTQWELGKRAAGNEGELTRDEQLELLKMQRNEQQYFINLLRDVREGTWGMDPFRRIAMYARAAQEAFWAGRVLSDLSNGIYWKWVMNIDKENCTDCEVMRDGGRWRGTRSAGIYSARELAQIGVFPQSGALKCCTNCRCRLKRVDRPAIKPKQSAPVASMQILGPQQSSFSGQGRRGRGALGRLADEYRWGYKGRIRMSASENLLR